MLRGPGAVLAVGLFALSPGIALYAAETKQYSSDILVALALTELVLQWLERPDRRRTGVLVVAGLIAPFFSQPAVFVLAGLGELSCSPSRGASAGSSSFRWRSGSPPSGYPLPTPGLGCRAG